MMWGAIKSIFGSGDVIEKGMGLLDAAFYTDQEKAADVKAMLQEKTKAKTEMLKAYAPFKIAQRVLAFLFAGQFLLVFNVALVLLFLDKPIQPLLDIADTFYLHYIMLTIVGFYFSGGMLEGVIGKVKKP